MSTVSSYTGHESRNCQTQESSQQILSAFAIYMLVVIGHMKLQPITTVSNADETPTKAVEESIK